MLHCLGLDHKRLTYRYLGRDFRLTDVAGNVVQKLIAQVPSPDSIAGPHPRNSPQTFGRLTMLQISAVLLPVPRNTPHYSPRNRNGIVTRQILLLFSLSHGGRIMCHFRTALIARLALICALLAVPLMADPPIAVVEKKAGKVGFYSPEGNRLSEVKVGVYPHEMVFSRDRKLLYVSDNGVEWMTSKEKGFNTISIIDVATRQKVGVIDLGQYYRPHSMAMIPKTGQLVVTIENPHGLLLVDPEDKKVLRKYSTKGEAPHMLILGPHAETAWASNANTGEVAVVNLSSGVVEKLIPTGKNPQGAVLTKDGKRIYLTNTASNVISILDPVKREIVGEIKTGNGPARIVLTADEKTLVYNLMVDEAVAFADVETGKETGMVKLPGQPLSISKTADGRVVYLGIQDKDKIAVVSVPDRKIIRVIDTPAGAGPDTVAPL